MRRIQVSAFVGPLSIAISLITCASPQQVLHAQTAPTAGTTVAVRMIDTVNSGKDPAGRQYRAVVTRTVNAGDGVIIPQGAVAAVTLMNSGNGSGWTTHLVSVTINGQPVAVASDSGSMTSAGQSAAINAMNSVGSMLGGFGHHVSAPASVVAAATGQHVSLPTGTTLTFVLSQPPAGSSSPTATASAAPAPNPVPASNPASGPAATPASAGGPVTGMGICFSNPPPTPSDPNHNKEYLTAVFEFPANTVHANVSEAAPPFAAYLKATYQYSGARITCLPIWTVADAKAAQKAIIADYHAPGLKRIDTGWRYDQPPVAQGQSGFDPLAQGPGGLDLSQHRLTTYYCKLLAPGGTSMLSQPGAPDQTLYVSPIFQADWDSDTVSRAYQVYIQNRYVPDLSHLSQAYTNPWCWANSPALLAQNQPHEGVGKTIHHKVSVDFTYAADQAAASHGATASENAASLKAAAALGPNQSYAYCYSDPTASPVYFSDIFAASTPPPTGHGKAALDQAATSAAAAVEGSFQAFLQKKYGAKNSAICRTGISAAALQAAQDQKKKTESNLVSRSKGIQIVETGWKGQ